MEGNFRQTIAMFISYAIIGGLFFLVKNSRPKNTSTRGRIFGYPRFLWLFMILWITIFGFFIFAGVYNFAETGENPFPFILPFVIFVLIAAFTAWVMKAEYLEVSADGNILTKVDFFNRKTVFNWNNVVEIKEGKYSGFLYLILSDEKKVYFSSMWVGRTEFSQLISQKRPDLFTNFKS